MVNGVQGFHKSPALYHLLEHVRRFAQLQTEILPFFFLSNLWLVGKQREKPLHQSSIGYNFPLNCYATRLRNSEASVRINTETAHQGVSKVKQCSSPTLHRVDSLTFI